jgi:ABC-type polysaccharide/polyol phosphate transport system ATPase subunit
MAHVSVQDVNVRIPVYDAGSQRLLRMPSFGRARVGTRTVSHAGATFAIQALSDVRLDLKDGDRVCLMGHNGSGKTTMLRLIAGIYPPATGTVEVQGKVMALLGGNLALNPDATGYENIELIANLFDWPKAKVSEYKRDIEDFTELGEYLALPIRTYSLGMLARLGFAMATMEAPDVLLIDEGIGAGDARFQAKAEKRINDFVSRAKIMLLATHSAQLARALCSKALLLSNGRLAFSGSLEETLERYRGSP